MRIRVTAMRPTRRNASGLIMRLRQTSAHALFSDSFSAPREASNRAKARSTEEIDADADPSPIVDAVPNASANVDVVPQTDTRAESSVRDDEAQQLAADAALHCVANVLPQPIVPLVTTDLSNVVSIFVVAHYFRMLTAFYSFVTCAIMVGPAWFVTNAAFARCA